MAFFSIDGTLGLALVLIAAVIVFSILIRIYHKQKASKEATIVEETVSSQ
jgi:hypothetical protein